MKSKAQQASVAPTVMRQFAQCNSHVHRLSICCFLSKTDVFIAHILREFGIREARYANYRVAVGLLVGQGWEQRRPTLPKQYILSFKAVGLGLFTFELSVLGKPMAKNYVIRQWHLPAYPSIDWTTAAVNVKRPRPSALFCYSICKIG